MKYPCKDCEKRNVCTKKDCKKRSDILRKKHIYEDHALRIQETGKYYKIKWL